MKLHVVFAILFCFFVSFSVSLAEAQETTREFKLEEIEPQTAMSIRFKVAAKSEEIVAEFAKAGGQVIQYLTESGVQPSGPPFGRYHAFDNGEADLEVGIPVAKPIAAKDEIQASELPGGKVLTTVHVGPYNKVKAVHSAIKAYAKEKGLRPSGGLWESIVVGPYQTSDPEKFETKLYLPLQDSEDADSLPNNLLGAWAFAGKPGSTDEPKPDAAIKVFGLNDFVIVRSDSETGEVINCHGGDFSLEEDTYVETVKFGNATRKMFIGKTLKFKLRIVGDELIQEGIDNNFNERWVRRKPE